jgi:flagellar assembly protein FliH
MATERDQKDEVEGFQEMFAERVSPSGRKAPGDRADSGPVEFYEDDPFDRADWLKAIEDKAREEGFRAGEKEGLAQGLKEADEVKRTLLAWADALPTLLADSLLGRSGRLSEIVVAALAKLLGEALARPEGVKALIERLVRERAGTQEAALWVSPEAHALMSRTVPDWVEDLRGRHIEVLASDTLSGAAMSLHIQDRVVAFDPLESLKDLDARLAEGGTP